MFRAGNDRCQAAPSATAWRPAKAFISRSRSRTTPGQVMGRQIEPPRRRCHAVHEDVVARPLFKAEMVECLRQARLMVAIKAEHSVAPAGPQGLRQDLEHLVGSDQPVEVAQKLPSLRQAGRVEALPQSGIDLWSSLEPRAVITHRDDENEGSRSHLFEDAQHLMSEIGVGAVGRPARPAQAFAAEKVLEAQAPSRSDRGGKSRDRTDEGTRCDSLRCADARRARRPGRGRRHDRG